MPKPRWKPSLEEGAVLCVIRTHPQSAYKAPLVAQTVFRWVAERNRPALNAAEQALTGQEPSGRGRPRKVPQNPKTIAAFRALLVRFFQAIPPPMRTAFLQARLCVAKQAQGIIPQRIGAAADAMLRGHLRIKSRTLKGMLSTGNKELQRPLALTDLIGAAGNQVDAWGPVAHFLQSIPARDRQKILSALLPPDPPSHL